jgi:uncharacterized protein (TIGR02271 family)
MAHDWLGSPVTDPSGERFGTLVELFVGKQTGRPEFGFVALGNGEERVAVPLAHARPGPDALVLPFPAERVLAAPRVQADVDEIPAEVGELILEHFGVEREEPSEADTEVVVSEEQLAVETRMQPTERVRVRKAVVTEDVTLTVTVRREELVIEREPIVPTSHQAADGEFALPDGQGPVEFVLHAEEPVVTKRVVPVEKVRLNRNTITEERRIADTVRRERVDVEVDETPANQEDMPR